MHLKIKRLIFLLTCFEEQATRRVKLGLVVAEIIKSEELKADEAESS